MAIDDRIAKIREMFGPEDEAELTRMVNDDLPVGLVQAGEAASLLGGIVAAFAGVFNTADEKHRVRTAFFAMCDEFYAIRKDLPSDAEDAIKLKWFRRGVNILIEEARRAEDEGKAAMLAIVAVHGCFPDGKDRHRQEDLASYIRDLAQLGTDDIQMLVLLCDVYANPTTMAPNLNRPDMFSEHYAAFKKSLDERKIHFDDSISIGARLSGFGLAYEAQRNTTRQSPEEIFFRPTLRGIYLLELMRKAEQSLSKRDNTN